MEIIYKKTDYQIAKELHKELFESLAIHSNNLTNLEMINSIKEMSGDELGILQYFNCKIRDRVSFNSYYYDFFGIKIHNSAGTYRPLDSNYERQIPQNFIGIAVPGVGAYNFNNKNYIYFGKDNILTKKEMKEMFDMWISNE